jgi:hypothetical protein
MSEASKQRKEPMTPQEALELLVWAAGWAQDHTGGSDEELDEAIRVLRELVKREASNQDSKADE